MIKLGSDQYFKPFVEWSS